jgi:DNA-binding winged helix-turn-helix (wHTH) protein/TolB-like protein/Tfp pilus assembly protein PilF
MVVRTLQRNSKEFPNKGPFVSTPLERGHFYEFGPFSLDPAERRLLRENLTVSLSPKSFDLLVLLVENQNRLVTKTQILDSVWAGSFVEESNLTVSISAIRRTLGEREGGVPYIETVQKAGYRFVATVRIVRSVPTAAVYDAKAGPPWPDTPISEDTGSASSTVAFGPEHQVDPLPTQPLENDADAVSSASSAESLAPQIAPVKDRSRPGILALGIVGVAITIVLFALAMYRHGRQSQQTDAARQMPRTLAILPFRNLKDDPKTDFLGFSLADAVITKVGRVNGISVRPSSAVEKYRGQVIDIQRVAGDLKVDTILAANIVHEGDDLRITPQLIDVRTNKILWKGSIDLKYDKLLTVQDKVAQEIVKGLELNLSPSELETLNANVAVSPLAYEYYLHGVDLYGRGEFPLSIKMLEKSAEIDPSYALTWAQIGRAYTAEASFKFGGRDQYQKAQAAYEKALALEPAQVETRIYMANLLTDTGRVEQAVPLLRESLKMNPNHPELHWELGYAYRYGGMLPESIAESEHARQIDPGVKITTSAVNGYLYMGKYDQFLRSLPDDNESAFVLFYRGFAKYYQRDFQQATQYFNRAFELDPSMFQAQVGKALSYVVNQEPDKGLAILRAIEKKIQERGVGDPEAAFKVAEAYAELGDRISALRMLRHSVEHGFFPYPYFQSDRLLDALRRDPEFTEVMTMARKRHESFSATFF